MKQTNSTLTFLAAQYRAVLQDAYLKGLASTALLSTAAMASVYSSVVEAADLGSLEELQNAGEYTLDSGSGAKDLQLNKALDWKGNLTVNSSVKGNPHKLRSYADDADITGNGSLTMKGNGAVLALGEPAGNYEFNMDIGRIDVRQGEIRLRAGYHQQANVQLSADEINVGTGNANESAIIHVADIYGNGSKAVLGREASGSKAASAIKLKSGGMILMNGRTVDQAVLQGNITSDGGTISFAENQGTQDFNNNGTIKATGELNNITIKVGGGEKAQSKAVFDFDKALTTLPDSDTHLKINSGTLEIEGNASQSKTGTVEIRNGTLELGEAAKLSNKHKQNALLIIGDGNTDQQGKLKASWSQINSFVNAPSGSNNHNGTIHIKEDGVLQLYASNSNPVSISSFKFNNQRMMGEIQLSDGATIAADKLIVDRVIKKGDKTNGNWKVGDYLNLKADTLHLQESGSSANIDYQFKKATVKNLELTASGDTTFNLKNKIEFVNTEESENPYDGSSARPVVAGKGTINKAVKLENSSAVHVAAGDITASGRIELSGGDLTVGGAGASADSKGVDASLAAKGGLQVWNTKPSTIKIHGNGEQDIATGTKDDGGLKDPVKYQSHSSLDLTKGNLTVTGNGTNKTTFDVQNGTLKLSAANAAELLNVEGKRSGNKASGAAVFLGGNASMEIVGDLQGKEEQGKRLGFATDKIQQAAGASNVASDLIGLSGSGNTIAATNVHLQGDSLDLGDGNTIKSTMDMKLDERTQGKNFTISTGTVAVGKDLTASRLDQQLIAGNSGGKTATLELGFAERSKDRFGQMDSDGAAGQLVNVSQEIGSVDMDIRLEGIDADKLAALKVKYGCWTAQNIDASNKGLIEVGLASGAGETAAPQYGTGTPVLSAKTVTLADGSKVVVHEQASLDFDKLDMKGGSIDSRGEMNFDELAMTGGTIDTTRSITTDKMSFLSGSVSAAQDISSTGAYKTDIKNSKVSAGNDFIVAGDLSVDAGELKAGQDISVAGKLYANNGNVYPYNITAGNDILADELEIVRARLQAGNDITVFKDLKAVGGVTEAKGNINVGKDLTVTTGVVTAHKTLDVANNLNMEGGAVSAGEITVAKNVVMNKGAIGTVNSMLVSGNMSVSSGTVTVNKDLIADSFDIRGGELKVKGNTVAAKDYNLAGTADLKVSGTLEAAGINISGASVQAGRGLKANNVTITAGSMSVNGGASADILNVSGGKLTSSGKLAVKNMVITGGDSSVAAGTGADGTAMNGELTADNFTMSSGTLTISGTMIAGKAPSGSTEADRSRYGFTTAGGSIDITGPVARLELGKEALQYLEFNNDIHGNNGNEHPDGWQGTALDPLNKYANNISLNDGAHISFELDSGTVLTAEDLKNLKKEFLADPDKVLDGTVDLGGAQIAGLNDVIGPNGDADWQKLKAFISDLGLQGIKNDQFAAARLVNIKSGEKVVAHAGSMVADGNTVTLGNGSLNKAAGNGGDFITDKTNGNALADAVLDAGASFDFNNGGRLNNITLTAGTEADQTNLVIGGDSSTATTINKISGGSNTNVFINALTSIAQDIDTADQLKVSSQATVSGNVTQVKNVALLSGGSLDVVKNIDGSTLVSIAAGSSLDVKGDITNVHELEASGKVNVTGAVKTRYLTGKASTGADGQQAAVLQAGSLEVSGAPDSALTEYAGDLKIAGTASFGSQSRLSGTNDFGTLQASKDMHLAKGNTTAGVLQLTPGVQLRAGSEGSGGTARMMVGRADLNGGTLIADPAYGEAATIVALNTLGAGAAAGPGSGPGTDTGPDAGTGPVSGPGTGPEAGGNASQGGQGGASGPAHGAAAKLAAAAAAAAAVNGAGELNGTVVALRNSVVAMGTESSDIDSAVREIQTAFAPYFTNGSLQDPSALAPEQPSVPEGEGGSGGAATAAAGGRGAVGAIAYVARPVTMASGSKIVVDAGRSYEQYQAADADYKAKVAQNDIYLDKHSALAMHNNAVNNKDRAAITFEKADASIYAREDARILIAGSSFNPNAPIRLFEDADGKVTLVTEDNKAIKVESVNGLFEAPDGLGPGQVDDLVLSVNQEVAQRSYSDVSAPVRQTLAAYGGFDNDPARAPVHGDLAAGISYDADKQQFTDANGTVLTAGKYVPVKNKDGSYSVYHAANNPLLNHVITSTNEGRDAEAVARMAGLGGVSSATLAASESLSDAVAERTGMTSGGDGSTAVAQRPAVPWINDRRNAQLSSAPARGAIWLTPTYRKVDSSGLSADDKSYGTDVDLNGLTAGMDVRVHPQVEVGGAVSVGTAKSSSSGLVSGVDNDGKYMGLAAYGRYKQGNTSVLADVSYTKTDNDLSTTTALGQATASVDGEALSVGITARQQMKMGNMDVSPHAGIRYTRLETSGHDVQLNGSTIAQASGDTQNVVSIPVGVTVSRNIQQGTWSIKPSLDLTLTANAGDKSTGSEVKWQGVNNLTTSLDTQVVDDVTAGVKAGVTMRSGRFAAGAGVSYTASQNVKDLAIQANARYDY